MIYVMRYDLRRISVIIKKDSLTRIKEGMEKYE